MIDPSEAGELAHPASSSDLRCARLLFEGTNTIDTLLRQLNEEG